MICERLLTVVYLCFPDVEWTSEHSVPDSRMYIHQNVTPSRTKLTCHLCGKVLSRSSALKCHIDAHVGRKPYRCSFCLKGFTQKGNLNLHIRSHTKEKPYKCDLCRLAFSHSSHLKRHKDNIHKHA